ncbi:centrosomal protein [Pyrus ussuriensis x Pyrus communis]|uniref:Centrosomal protein n=1 Tax=Pyrus ussuriensis x Pyrus communis TaxID=2448454 RepID=A0A5N5FFA2_9ROSA|nr:centrosomal protein [Pyrus ussuriensis x Pyrus communis]
MASTSTNMSADLDSNNGANPATQDVDNNQQFLSIPHYDILKEIIGAEVFDIDIDRSNAAAINGKVAHLLQVVRHLIEITVIVHVDGAPHERLVLADVAPSPSERSPNLDSSQSRQYQNGDVLWKFQPVPHSVEKQFQKISYKYTFCVFVIRYTVLWICFAKRRVRIQIVALMVFNFTLLPASSTASKERLEDHSFDGIATNVKLLLKLIQEQNEACTKDNDDRKMQRVAGMMTIIDDVKTRIQKSQTVKRRAELRRCNTDLRPNVPRDKRPPEPVIDEKERLRRQLSASLAARKSLEIMCSGLGKEKEIIASELARKVQELTGMEEHINDLRAQNEMLLAKVQACAAEHKEKRCAGGGVEIHGNAALQERNKALSEQLLKSLDGCRSLKRKIKDAQKENNGMHSTMEEMGVEVQGGLERICALKQKIATSNEQAADIEEEISALEHLFESFSMKILKHGSKKGESAKNNTEIDTT